MKILFIGNSYSFNLPETIAELAAAHAKTFAFNAVTKGGWTLRQHAESAETLQAIQTGGWDYVVLQEQSQIPSFTEQQRTVHMYPYAESLHTQINRTGAKTLFYQTWGHVSGDKRNIPDDSFVNMQQRLQQGYANAAQRCSASVVPVGTAWAAAQNQTPSINLYQSDGSHPNDKGVYLSACIFLRVLFNLDVQQKPKLSKQLVPAAEAELLACIANSMGSMN